jgi:DNA-binding response OmpR family regulator/HPt (histidine-containing phosphotransfer) domain-containing protein
MRILLVEDDDSVAKALEKVFISEHYAVDIAGDGQAGWQLVETFNYDLILLDVILPKLDGIEFCQRLRAHDYQMPVLLITAQHSSASRVIGLDAGADDYITKPFELEELLARIRVLLRRANSPVLTVLEWGELQLNPNTHEVTYGNHPLHLTPKEYRLLELFLRKQPHVFSRSTILDSLWTNDEAPGEDTVTAHIKGLRRKLKQAGAPADFIMTVYGIGYRLKPLKDLKSGSSSSLPSSLEDSKPLDKHSIRQQTQAALAEVWQKFNQQNSDRLSTLKQAAIASTENRLTHELRQRARQAAHSLAGALGVFGFVTGSGLAKDIEHQLTAALPNNQLEKQHLADLVTTLEREMKQALSGQRQAMFRQILPLMILIDNNLELAEHFVVAARTQGLNVRIVPNLTTLRALLSLNGGINLNLGTASPRSNSSPESVMPDIEDTNANFLKSEPRLPDIVLLNFSLNDANEESLHTLSKLINQPPPIPVLVCSADGSLANRVKAARLGTPSFLHNMGVHQMLEVATRVRSHLCHPSANVLIVDDDPQVLAALRSLLEPWGFRLTTLEQPPKFWHTLETCSPDLLVLDVEMPYFNGIDLCRVVRHTPAWSELPILFLTVHTDANTEHEVFTAGANDLIDKSLTESELITRIFNQLERLHLRRTIMAINNKG